MTPQEINDLQKRLELAEKLLAFIFNPNFLHQSPPPGYTETLEEWIKLKKS